MKEEQESSQQATQESAAGRTRTTAEKGEDTGWDRGRGHPGGSLILDGLACQVLSSWPRHGWGPGWPCLPGIFFMTSSRAGPPIMAPSSELKTDLCSFVRKKRKCQSLGRVWLFATLWTAACPAPLSMGFSRQEYRSGLPCLPPGDLPDSGIEPWYPTL